MTLLSFENLEAIVQLLIDLISILSQSKRLARGEAKRNKSGGAVRTHTTFIN